MRSQSEGREEEQEQGQEEKAVKGSALVMMPFSKMEDRASRMRSMISFFFLLLLFFLSFIKPRWLVARTKTNSSRTAAFSPLFFVFFLYLICTFLPIYLPTCLPACRSLQAFSSISADGQLTLARFGVARLVSAQLSSTRTNWSTTGDDDEHQRERERRRRRRRRKRRRRDPRFILYFILVLRE